jgi:hypothetical protein
MTAKDVFAREELSHPMHVWRFPVWRLPLFERLDYDPRRIRKELNKAIEAAMNRLRESSPGSCRSFIVWTK